jgi:hypothetical protein
MLRRPAALISFAAPVSAQLADSGVPDASKAAATPQEDER